MPAAIGIDGADVQRIGATAGRLCFRGL